MAISDILELGRQALTANRNALQTTSNNIANANTPGYSRQKPIFETRGTTLQQGIRLGGGVEVTKVVRAHDAFIHNQLIEESRTFGAAQARAEGLKRLEGLVHSDEFRIGDLVNKFFNDVRDLSVNPETAALRTTVASSAESTAQGFRKINESLNAMKADIDNQMSFSIEEINSQTRELASLNAKIAMCEGTGDTPNELYDRRDQIQRDLSRRLGFQTFTDDHGHVNLSAGGLGIIVQGAEAHDLVAHRTPQKGQKGAGSVDIFVKDAGGDRNVTRAIKDGELGGLLHVRDNVISGALGNLDRVAYEFVGAVNTIHREGEGADGVAGRGLFGDLSEQKDASHFIDLSADIRANNGAVAAGYTAEAAGDNRIALRIAELQNEKVLPLSQVGTEEIIGVGAESFNESLNNIVAQLGVTSASEANAFRHQEAVMTQLENYRESISGVSLEEEAINMMQFQAVFNAAAKAMKVGDELFQTILSIKD